MSTWLRTGTVITVLGLVACGSSPKPALYTLTDALQQASPTRPGLRVAVMPTGVPELFDRPQLVIRREVSRVQVLEQQRWAEPLRYEISRRLATDLALRLDSSGVIALPEDVQSLDPDYRVLLDVQHIDAAQDRLGVDVAWRLVARNGKVRHGRSVHVESVETSGNDRYVALVSAYRRVFARVADDVAAALREPAPD